jgi:hypothetical protein
LGCVGTLGILYLTYSIGSCLKGAMVIFLMHEEVTQRSREDPQVTNRCKQKAQAVAWKPRMKSMHDQTANAKHD